MDSAYLCRGIKITCAFVMKRKPLPPLLPVGLLILAMAFSSCRQAYQVTRVEIDRIAIDDRLDAEPDTAMTALLAPYKAAVDSVMNHVLGTAAVSMDKDRPESLLSNLVADVLRQAATIVQDQPADMGLVNMGGLRSTLTAGPITRAHAFEILPFENALCVLTIKGSDLRKVMENIAARGGEGVSGVQLTIGRNGQLLGATVDGRPIDDNRLYSIATIDYLAEGNDGLTALTLAQTRTCPDGAVLRDLFIRYVESETAAGRAITSQLEGRIIVR